MKSPKRKTRKSAPEKLSILGGLIRSIVGLFAEELPVSKYAGVGKFPFEVANTGKYQPELETLCGGRSTKSVKRRMEAVIVPQKDSGMRVEIDGMRVGDLKPKDARALGAVQADAHAEPFVLHVPALVEGGRSRRSGKDDAFTVRVDLPLKPPVKKTAKASLPAKSKRDSAEADDETP